ncbi:MAG TPA: alpha/beta hydrolase [Burkholderiales bacterium]|nr:alpha/beta hydrolase [Burkholderiales bacterium]
MRVLLLALALAAQFCAAEDRYFDSAGVRIRYVERGAGVPVVLVHGFTGGVQCCWIDNGILPELARDHRVIAFDLRGHGVSAKPHDPAAYDEIGRDVIRLLDHLGLSRAHVVGFSLGGIIVAKLLTTDPGRFSSAILAGAAPRRSRGVESDLATEEAAREMEKGSYRTLILATAPTDEPPPSEAVLLARSKEIVARNDPFAHAALMRARRALLVADADIAAVRVPAMAIIGSADPALPRVQALKKRWPKLEVVVIQGATHPAGHPRGLLTRRELVAEVRAFIASHDHGMGAR